MKKIYLIILISVISISTYSQSWLWTTQIGSNNNIETEAVTIDNDQNIITFSELSGTTTVGTSVLTAISSKDLLIIKSNKYGKLLWVKQIGNSLIDDPKNVYIDKYNNIFITGSFEGTLNFGSSSITSIDGKDAFLAKYDKDGNEVWAKNIGGGSGIQKGRAIISDGNNLFVTGFFKDENIIESDTLSGNGVKNYFLLKLDNLGNLLSVSKIEHRTNDDYILLNNLKYLNGNLYLSGYFTDTLSCQGTTVVNKGNRDIVLLKFNPNGDLIWIKNYGGNSIAECWGMDVDDNYIYLSGHYIDSLKIDDIDLSTIDGTDIFVTKIDENGIAQWARTAGSSENNSSLGLCVSNNKIYITGKFSGNFNWGTNTVSIPSGNYDPYVGVINSQDGTMENIYDITTSNNSAINQGYSLICDHNNHLYLTGTFKSNTLTFNDNLSSNINTINLTNTVSGKKDAFVTKFGCFEGVKFDIFDAGCTSNNDGSITVTPNEGQGPFNYSWSNGNNTSTISNLSSGDYIVTVSDNSGCSVIDTAHVNYHSQLSASISSTTDVLCSGDSTGEIAVSTTGGYPPITYNWSNNDTNSVAENLPAGDYYVTVNDRCNNSVNLSANISEPDPLDVNLTGKLYNFFSICIAKVTAQASGGVSPYTYTWYHLNGDSIGTGETKYLTGGEYYIIQVTDANGCSKAWWFYVPDCSKAAPESNGNGLDQDNEKDVVFTGNNNNGGFSINSDENDYNNLSDADKKGISALIQDNILDNNLNVYPNPSNKYVNISLNNLETVHNIITIYNSIGSVVYKTEVKDLRYEFKINISNLDEGIYFIEVNTELNKYRKQIVIAR